MGKLKVAGENWGRGGKDYGGGGEGWECCQKG